MKLFSWLFMFGFPLLVQAQVTTEIKYIDPVTSEDIKLEAFIYEPRQPNGKVIVFNHGSTGGKANVIAESIKFLGIGRLAANHGYVMVTFMRKGRGKSGGVFVEESGKCDRASLTKEVADAMPQIEQVIQWVKGKYPVGKVILMGHSRGGFLSSHYASKHPDQVLGAVSLAGVWSAFCENRNGGFSHDMFQESSAKFKQQYWAYFDNDSYFAKDRFNDENYVWFAETAQKNGVTFKKYPQLDRKDGHETGTWRPDVWANDIFPWLDSLK